MRATTCRWLGKFAVPVVAVCSLALTACDNGDTKTHHTDTVVYQQQQCSQLGAMVASGIYPNAVERALWQQCLMWGYQAGWNTTNPSTALYILWSPWYYQHDIVLRGYALPGWSNYGGYGRTTARPTWRPTTSVTTHPTWRPTVTNPSSRPTSTTSSTSRSTVTSPSSRPTSTTGSATRPSAASPTNGGTRTRTGTSGRAGRPQ